MQTITVTIPACQYWPLRVAALELKVTELEVAELQRVCLERITTARDLRDRQYRRLADEYGWPSDPSVVTWNDDTCELKITGDEGGA